MKVFYNNFWKNFNGVGLDNLFKIIFQTDIVETKKYEEADILCDGVFINSANFLDKKVWKYSFLISYENYLRYDETRLRKYTCILSGFVGSPQRIAYPYFYSRMLIKDEFHTHTSIPLKQFCAVLSNDGGKYRNAFLNELEKIVKVDYGGAYKNNIGRKIEGVHSDSKLINFYKEYKFVFAMENSKGDYYITEKLYNALKSGGIPVYWGSPNLDTFINPKRILYVRNETKEEMARIINIIHTMTDEEYLSIIKEPIFIKPFDELFQDKIKEIQILLNLVK